MLAPSSNNKAAFIKSPESVMPALHRTLPASSAASAVAAAEPNRKQVTSTFNLRILVPAAAEGMAFGARILDKRCVRRYIHIYIYTYIDSTYIIYLYTCMNMYIHIHIY